LLRYTFSDAGVHGIPDPAHSFALEVANDRSFEGGQSLRSFLRDAYGQPGWSTTTRHLTHELVVEQPITTTEATVSLWRSDTSYTTSSRYAWNVLLHFDDGTNVADVDLACRCWGNSEGCPNNYVEASDGSAEGSDGTMWLHYTVTIPPEIDRSGFTLSLIHRQDAWDGTTAESTIYFDGISIP